MTFPARYAEAGACVEVRLLHLLVTLAVTA